MCRHPRNSDLLRTSRPRKALKQLRQPKPLRQQHQEHQEQQEQQEPQEHRFVSVSKPGMSGGVSSRVQNGAVVEDDDDYVIVPPHQHGNPDNAHVSPRRSVREGIMPSPVVTAGPVLVSSRESTPTMERVLSYESLSTRPRSNPRTRTPMRYESPLNSDAFRTLTIDEEAAGAARSGSRGRVEGRRVTVRPLAGAAVGTVLAPRRVSYANWLVRVNAHNQHWPLHGPSGHARILPSFV